jgi:hypothetical protein
VIDWLSPWGRANDQSVADSTIAKAPATTFDKVAASNGTRNVHLHSWNALNRRQLESGLPTSEESAYHSSIRRIIRGLGCKAVRP